MKSKRIREYLKNKKPASPVSSERDIAQNTDGKTNQDFPGSPGGQAKKELINPKTATEKKTAAVGVKDGEKMNSTPAKRKRSVDEQQSDGSGGAFGGTEDVKE